MSTYLVTGGAGFIGHHIATRLLAEGHRVRVLDNLSTGKRERIPQGAELVEADMQNLEAIRPAFEGIDGVFHTAALPRVQVSVEDPVGTSEINIMGTLNVLVAARDAKVKRVVYSASSSAYGDQTTLPLHLGLVPHPMSPYGVQKYVGELFCSTFSRLYGIETVSLRYFNVYGPNMADDGAYVTVISIFKQQALANKPLTVTGDGEQTRDFTHVDDVVNANVLAMTSAKVGKGEVVNIGAGDRHSVNEIVKLFGRAPEFIPARPGDPKDTLADISLTRELLGWEPKVKFEDGVNALLKDWGLLPS
jgi:nucleoside-diphosphate-sugar epimerase